MERKIEKVSLNKVYNFSAAHRLFIKSLSAEENFEIFDKCSNINGHGHNYKLEVSLYGSIAEETGFVVDPKLVDKEVNEVIDRLDHKRLDLEVPYFENNQSTGENIAKFFWDILSSRFGNHFLKIRVWENDRSYFDYFEEKIDER